MRGSESAARCRSGRRCAAAPSGAAPLPGNRPRSLRRPPGCARNAGNSPRRPASGRYGAWCDCAGARPEGGRGGGGWG
ncbi:hypothetical protein G6F24_018593 [Rhizopus arrhizus]|nr:hypothetical protein G6F24_018593 [Rhizopus arrhizus]